MTSASDPFDLDQFRDDTYQPKMLHACGPHIDVLKQEFRFGDETFTVDVNQYPNNPRLAGRAVVTLGSHDGDGGPANMWWDFDPDAADQLAVQLLHNATIARDFNAQVN